MAQAESVQVQPACSPGQDSFGILPFGEAVKSPRGYHFTATGDSMAGEDRHFTHSTLRERIVEHVFVGDVLRTLWRRGVSDVEILRPEFDAHGYDVVMSRGPVVRHVQLKTQAGGKVSVARALAEKPSGCVVWIGLNKNTLELGPFMWFGGAPGEPLPDISGYPNPKRSTHNAEGVRPVRKNHHVLPAAAFIRLETLDEIVVRLFGEIPVA
jgi:hypothetical protein